MSDPLAPQGDGYTELTDEDREGLIPSYIATRADLYDAEQRNIAKALTRHPPTLERLLDDMYLRSLHKAMLGDVWSWAGRYRRLETNIGIDPTGIPPAVRTLVDDVRIWVELGIYGPDELAARFHHRLVQIHPFANGNGRHGRISADYLLNAIDEQPFSWGSNHNMSTDEVRRRYRDALRQADGGDISSLLRFCRS